MFANERRKLLFNRYVNAVSGDVDDPTKRLYHGKIGDKTLWRVLSCQIFGKVFARKGIGLFDNLFRSTFGNDSASGIGSSRPHVNNVVSGFHHLKVMFDNY